MASPTRIGLLVLLVVAAAPFARASTVAPGQRVFIELDNITPWPPPGTQIASKSIPFAIPFVPDVGVTLHGELTSAVFRRDDGGLTFGYNAHVTPQDMPGGFEAAFLTVGNYGGFVTDASHTDDDNYGQVRRSADGRTLEFEAGSPGGIDPPIVWVGTDARSFDAKGTALWTFGDEFVFPDPSTGLAQTVVADGSKSFDGLFEPTAQGTPIPLPPAAWTGAAAMAALGAAGAARRAIRGIRVI